GAARLSAHLRRRGHLRDGELAGSLSPAAARGRGVALLRALSDGLRVARAGLHYALASPPCAHSLVAASAEGRAAAPGGGLDRSENLRRGGVEGQALWVVEAADVAQAPLGRG